MWKSVCVLLYLCAVCNAGPLAAYQKRKTTPAMAREDPAIAVTPAEEVEVTEMEESEPSHVQEAKPLVPSSTLTLPSNATSIRADITDNFSCTNKTYGYYADVENDCQIFHVCLPVTYADGKENIFRWSFICPEETIFNQESFTCMRREDMTIECEDSYRYYELNGNFGAPVEEEKNQENEGESKPMETEPMEEVAPAESVKPQPEIVKPVKVEKPKRKPSQGRPKPAVFYKQPVRKTPEQEVAQASEPLTPIKPQRVSVPIKEKPLTQSPAQSQSQSHPSKPVRGDFFLTQRKRNKPSSTTTTTTTTTMKPLREEPITVTFEAKPTLEVETLFQEPQPVVVKSEEPLAEASEPAVVLVAQPEEIQTEEEQTKPVQDEDQEKQDVQLIEAIEEIPAVIVESLEAVKKPQADKEQEDTKEELKIIENEKEEPEQPEEEKEIEEEKEEPAKVLEITKEPEQTPLEPAIEESTNSQEESSNQIEELEAQKPQNAPQSMPATEAMEQPNPLVDEILNTDSPNNEAQQSLGGFKPVDPVMAAEAEQLITDFLNTLKKTEEKTETELAMEMAETLDKEDKEKPHAHEAEGVSVEELKLPEPEIVDKNASVEEQLLEEEQKLKHDSPIINIMQLSHPEDYQIPVQIVSMEKEPITEIDIKPLDDKEEVPAAAAEVEPQEVPIHNDENQESLATAAYMPPISIDDIVELVKERLDQTPKTEQMVPMELVLTPGAEEPMALIPSSGQNQNQNQDEDKQQEASSSPIEKEDIILPIYKRITNADLAMANLQTLPVTSSKGDTETEPEKPLEPQPEVREPKSKLKMDARKRRFLFRADAS
ncbi:uncharacterized protein Dwil_GK17584 [Drosophila willistoni]|uniref:Chitin-binding type-2 domain-containing protein n=1 Tax=Drosophila willistoni TaxID=7260 RepID=B4MMV6_DROWI|nr:titin [Drosophila willistoni]EDW73512.1 uncharacterized protein Dwil_GK17584 [Drosophila willistoni]